MVPQIEKIAHNLANIILCCLYLSMILPNEIETMKLIPPLILLYIPRPVNPFLGYAKSK